MSTALSVLVCSSSSNLERLWALFMIPKFNRLKVPRWSMILLKTRSTITPVYQHKQIIIELKEELLPKLAEQTATDNNCFNCCLKVTSLVALVVTHD